MPRGFTWLRQRWLGGGVESLGCQTCEQDLSTQKSLFEAKKKPSARAGFEPFRVPLREVKQEA